jgi:hypothetical protein
VGDLGVTGVAAPWYRQRHGDGSFLLIDTNGTGFWCQAFEPVAINLHGPQSGAGWQP